jgi:two-component system sensor histidine kinase AlgZ
MNTIASLTRSDPRQAEVAVENLADLFRISLGDARFSYSLEEEISLCRRYLAIEALRLGDRLRLDWRLEPLPMDARVPPLLVQPLLENAVYHGIESMSGGGTISIKGERDGRHLLITIQNPIPPEGQLAHQKGNRLAVGNIQERLLAVYGKQARLKTEQRDGMYTVSIHFPYKKRDDEDTDSG